MNPHAFRLTQRLGFDYCSDTRGHTPYWPVVAGEVTRCPQIPSTLPTLDELIGLDGCTPDNAHERVLAAARVPAPYGHVYTLHAELEGMRLMPVFERLLADWHSQGVELVGTDTIAASLDRANLPHHSVEWTGVPGRSGVLAAQGPMFPKPAEA
jgi:hypothetical protein